MQYSSSSKVPSRTGKTEFEILKESHKFLRDEDEGKDLSWDEQLAAKYYASLYREFAVCDLKHYKSGNFALRWRTESEVLSGAGETTCGNTRCEHHSIPDHLAKAGRHTTPQLTTLELPFAYQEHGETKCALVKVVLCPRCLDKLMYKRRKEKQKALEVADEEDMSGTTSQVISRERSEERRRRSDLDPGDWRKGRGDFENRKERRSKNRSPEGQGKHRKRDSRSRSPRRIVETH